MDWLAWVDIERLWQVAQVVLGPIMSAVAGAIALRLGTSIPHRRLWKLRNRGPIVFALATSSIEETDDYFRAMTGTGQVRALARLTPSLQSAYHNAVDRQVFLSEELKMRQELVENHLVLLGGAKNNHWTRECVAGLFDRTGFRYVEDGNTMEFEGKLYNSKGEREAAKIEQNANTSGAKATKGFEKKIDRDWCVLICAQNPYNKIDKTKRLFVVAGAHTYGVDGAASLMTRYLIRKWFRPREYIAFAEVKVTTGGIYDMRLIKLKRLKRIIEGGG